MKYYIYVKFVFMILELLALQPNWSKISKTKKRTNYNKKTKLKYMLCVKNIASLTKNW